MKSDMYVFLKLADNTYVRDWFTRPSDAYERATRLARDSHGDVLVYRMHGAIRVTYKRAPPTSPRRSQTPRPAVRGSRLRGRRSTRPRSSTSTNGSSS